MAKEPTGPVIQGFRVGEAGGDGVHFADGLPPNLTAEGIIIDKVGGHGMFVGPTPPGYGHPEPEQTEQIEPQAERWYNRFFGQITVGLIIALLAPIIVGILGLLWAVL